MQVRMNLRLAREAKGLSQGGLANLLDTTQPYISQIETCQRNPGRSLGKRIAKILTGNPNKDGFLFDEGVTELEVDHATAN
ncbi:MAG: Helix-turn-helix domain [Firmicutes bacterium]|nr:Helix-turn-helix domain [Bacillota bacterium]